MANNKCLVSTSAYSIENLLCDKEVNTTLAPIIETNKYQSFTGTIPFIKLPRPNFRNNQENLNIKANLPPLRRSYGKENLEYTRLNAWKTHNSWDYYNDHVDDDYSKIRRKRATVKQTQALQKVFEMTAFPSTILRENLARYLGMSPRTVQVWFQNKRQAARKTFKQKGCLINNF
ncbi:uncharacterized protein EV154DRAFT_567756 [Mucor mucedo]|uniref:uncharacterized protein n=1 Tax=Mucor mucedo TaxID=29922 RepID=UPI00221EE16E|nr:uncharacterized protein EV154DRAFT_567756 [Mucor mucedo]KAI7885439.1 hypothetical protein EV154DRAFT_567756 [Mucor mucedo]